MGLLAPSTPPQSAFELLVRFEMRQQAKAEAAREAVLRKAVLAMYTDLRRWYMVGIGLREAVGFLERDYALMPEAAEEVVLRVWGSLATAGLTPQPEEAWELVALTDAGGCGDVAGEPLGRGGC